MSREKSLIKNTVILGIGYVIPGLVSFLTLPIYTAMLTKAEYGTYDLITILVSLLLPIASLQIKMAAFRFVLESRGNEEKIKKYISTICIFAVIIIGICLVITSAVLPGISAINRVLIGLYLFQEMIVDLLKQLARGLGVLKKYVMAISINSVLTLIFAAVLLSGLDKGLPGLLLALNIALLFANIYLIGALKIPQRVSYRYFSKKCLKEMLAYSVPMIPNAISLWVVKLSDRVIVTWFLGLEMNAIYAVANKIPYLLSEVTGVFNLAWQENASLAIEDEDAEEYYSNMSQTIIEVLIGGMAVLIAGTPILFKIFINESYGDAYNQIPILCWGIFFASLSNCCGSIYIALKKTKIIGVTSVAGAIINLLVNVALIGKIGLYAASLSTAVSYVVIYSFRVLQLKKYVNIKYNWKKNTVSFLMLFVINIIYYKKYLVTDVINIGIAIIFAIVLNKKLLLTMYHKYRKKVM